MFPRVSFDKQMSEWQMRVLAFFIGAVGYGCIEFLWRGYTHPSMLITGGACLMIIRRIDIRFCEKPILYRCIISSAAITYVEFWVGCIVNKILGLGVWDYSEMKLNFMGQVCIEYSFLWVLLSVPVILVLSSWRGGGMRVFSFESERKKQIRFKYKKTLFFLARMW